MRYAAVLAALCLGLSCQKADGPRATDGPQPEAVSADAPPKLPNPVFVRQPEITVELLPYQKDKSIYNRNPVIVRFTNASEHPVRILKPLDGSLWCWHMPYYKLAVEDGSGTELSLQGRCWNSGLWADTEWPDDYVVELKPGGTYEKELGLHHLVRTPGTYTVTFVYVYNASKAGATFPGITYPKELWEGEAKSDAVQLELKASL